MNINITEVISRSAQGMTRPFLCRCDDGHLYYIKGNYAGRKALAAEWIAGRLGTLLGLPIPNIAKVSVPLEIVRYSAREDIADLGAGTCFGSQQVENTDELRYPFVEEVDIKLRARVLLFDWWVCNPDRTLSPDGGNPNILWMARDHKAFVIDHNLALEAEEMTGFWSEHIFREAVSEWNATFRQEMISIFRRAICDLPGLWKELPTEWTEAVDSLTLESVKTLLSRFESEPCMFWRGQ